MANTGSNRSNYSEPKTQRDWHLWHVLNDPDFKEALELIQRLEQEKAPAGDIQQARQKVADYFRISLAELGRFELSQFLHLDHNERTVSLD